MATAFCSYQERIMDRGQFVDPNVEGFGQGHGDLDRRIGIIALAYIQETGDPADVSQFLVKETELAAGQGEDNRILRRLFHKLGVIIAARLGAVTAGHQEKVTDGLVLDRLDDRSGHAHHGIPAKTDGDRFPVACLRQNRAGPEPFQWPG